MFLDQIPKKTIGFFGILQNSKKTSSFPKFQKYLGKFIKVLEFWKTRGFFWILENSKKTKEFFFGILVENLKKTCVFFLEFAIKF